MPKLLAVAILVLTAGIALKASGGFFGKVEQPPETLTVGNRVIPQGAQSFARSGREQIPHAEAVLAGTRKLMPPSTKSLLNIPAPLRHGDYLWNEQGVPNGKLLIWVDLRRQMISVFRNGHEIGTAVIIYGAQNMPTPEGLFAILRKRRNYHSHSYDAPMPDSLFITNDGVALHGSPMSKRRASHGCIGLPAGFARKLFEAAEVGDIVEITQSDVR